jgi:hypothetical protein
MKNYAFVFMIELLVLTSEVMAQQSVDKIDLEVAVLLSLNDEQALAYSAIMQRQREVFQTLKPSRWEQQKAFYDETFARLKPVLTEEQYVRFVGYMDSFMEAMPEGELLVME